jgi:plastocyanin
MRVQRDARGLHCSILVRVFAALAVLALPAMAGDITGQVVVTKRLTKKVVSPIVYSLRGTPTPAPSTDVNPETEFDRIIVMLEGSSLLPATAQTVTMAQHNGRFEPDLVAVPVGSTVRFPNADPVFHNVFSLSRAQKFDLGYYPKSQSRSVKFTRSGIVQVYCHVHAGMSAAIVVTASPWFGKPSADGSFSWKDVPAGHYRLVAWHRIAGAFAAKVDVPEHGAVSVNIRVPVDVEMQP